MVCKSMMKVKSFEEIDILQKDLVRPILLLFVNFSSIFYFPSTLLYLYLILFNWFFWVAVLFIRFSLLSYLPFYKICIYVYCNTTFLQECCNVINLLFIYLFICFSLFLQMYIFIFIFVTIKAYKQPGTNCKWSSCS